MDDEWNQWQTDSRSLDTMRAIALGALELADDDDDEAFYAYAASRQLTANEVAYYLNAYQYGAEAGLRAIHNPDIIPPEVARRAIRTVARILDGHFEGSMAFRITDEGTAIGVSEIQTRWN